MTFVISFKPYKWFENPNNITYKRRKCWMYIQKLLTRALQYVSICKIKYSVSSAGWKGTRLIKSYVLRRNGLVVEWSQWGRIPGPQSKKAKDQDGKVQYMEQVDLFFSLNYENVYISSIRSKRNQDKVELKLLSHRAYSVIKEIWSSKEKAFLTGPKGS